MPALSEITQVRHEPPEAQIQDAEAKRKVEVQSYKAIKDFLKNAPPYTVFDAGTEEIIDLHPDRHSAGVSEVRIVKIDEIESDMVEIKPDVKPAQESHARRSIAQVRRTVIAGLTLLGEF